MVDDEKADLIARAYDREKGLKYIEEIVRKRNDFNQNYGR